MKRFSIEIADFDLRKLQATANSGISELLDAYCNQIVGVLGQFRSYLELIVFSTRYDDVFTVNEMQAGCGRLEIYANPMLFDASTHALGPYLLQTFVASLNYSADIFDICITYLAYCSERLGAAQAISLRIAPSFCDGTPGTLRQLKPQKVQSLVSLLSNTFLPISSAKVRCLRQLREYSSPIARVVDANGILSAPLRLCAASNCSDSRLNGSYLGILAETIHCLTRDGVRDGTYARIPAIFQRTLRESCLSVSLDDYVPAFYTNGSENVLQDYLPQRIHAESGGGDAGSFLDAPGTCVPVCHFLLAEQSTAHGDNIMSIYEYWIRICLKTAPPSAYLHIGERFDERSFEQQGRPLIILQISSIKSTRKTFFEYLESSSDAPAAGDDVINITETAEPVQCVCAPQAQDSCYFYRSGAKKTVYKLPESLLHAQEISDVLGDAFGSFQTVLHAAFTAALVSALQQCWTAVFRYVLAADLNYAAAKLKLLARDPNHARYALQRRFWEAASAGGSTLTDSQAHASEQSAKQQNHDFAFDVLQSLVSQRKIEFRAEAYELPRAEPGCYGRALVRKQNLSNHALMALFSETYQAYRAQAEARPLDQAQFADLLDKRLVQNDQCKFAAAESIAFNADVLFQGGMAEYSSQCLNYYNIVVQDWQQFSAPELEQEIILRRRVRTTLDQPESSGDAQLSADQDYVKFRTIALHQKRIQTLFPEMITVNGVGLLNDAATRARCVLQLDFGFLPAGERLHLYLFYQQTYPLLIKYLSKQLTEALTLPFKFEEHQLAFSKDPQLLMLTRNVQYRNSSYFVIPGLWELFQVRRIVLSSYLEDHDLVDLHRAYNGEMTVVLRVVNCPVCGSMSDFASECGLYEQVLTLPTGEGDYSDENMEIQRLLALLLPGSLTRELDLIFSQNFTNLGAPRKYTIAAFASVFECLQHKLRAKRLIGLLKCARTLQKYMLPVICSETQVVIPRHYPFLGENVLRALQQFVVRFVECYFNAPDAIKIHLHRILGACAFCYIGVGEKSGVHAAALTGCELKFRRGKLSIRVDSRSCEYIVKRHADVAYLASIADCRTRLYFLNPTTIYYFKDKIVLFSLLERKNDYYYFVIDNKFRLAVLAVPEPMYRSEFSPELFSRGSYSQGAACIISDGDILLENNYLCVYVAERAVQRFAATGDESVLEAEQALIYKQLFNQPYLANLRVEALRFFLADVGCSFRYCVRAYAHLQSFWAVSTRDLAAWAGTMLAACALCRYLPLTFSRVVNATHGTHFRERRVIFPLNLLFVNGNASSAQGAFLAPFLTALRTGREMAARLADGEHIDIPESSQITNKTENAEPAYKNAESRTHNFSSAIPVSEAISCAFSGIYSPQSPKASVFAESEFSIMQSGEKFTKIRVNCDECAYAQSPPEHTHEPAEPLTPMQELLRPVTVISQHSFVMLDEIDAERVCECEYERAYARRVGTLSGEDFTEIPSSFCVAEPSFCGFLLVVSANPSDWHNYFRATYTKYPQPEQLASFIAQTIDNVVDEFAATALTTELV